MPLIWYSIGSSMVMMFFSLELTRFSEAYSVVDLPLPVGPVTRMMPLVRDSIRSMICTPSAPRPISVRERMPFFLSSRRSTARSP